MNRPSFGTAAVLCALAFVPAISAQAAKATPAAGQAAPRPAFSKARMATPVKGTAFIEVIQGVSKVVGNDIVTVTKVKNMSNSPIAGLRVDEFWYNHKLVNITGDTQRVRAPIAPGEVIEVTTKSPVKPDLYKSQIMFVHANGKINSKGVRKFTEGKK
jgi:hypothetical protein